MILSFDEIVAEIRSLDERSRTVYDKAIEQIIATDETPAASHSRAHEQAMAVVRQDHSRPARSRVKVIQRAVTARPKLTVIQGGRDAC